MTTSPARLSARLTPDPDSRLAVAAPLLYLLALCFLVLLAGKPHARTVFAGLGLVALLAAVLGGRLGLTRCTLAAYVVGICCFGKQFSLVGHSPLYVGDVLVALAAIAAIPLWFRRRATRIEVLVAAAFLVIAALNLQAALRGIAAGYPEATKGLDTVLYPGAAAALIPWLRAHWTRIPGMLLAGAPAVALGMLVLRIEHSPNLIPAAYGFYLCVIASFVVVAALLRLSSRYLLIASLLVDLALLFRTGKRGPVLSVLLCLLIVRLVAAWWRPLSWRRWALSVALIAAGLSAAVFVGSVPLRRIPILGHFETRLVSTFTQPHSVARANIDIRLSLWRYALRQLNGFHALVGRGYARPFYVDFRGNNVATQGTVSHNGFIGTAYYAGYPAAVLLVATTCILLFLVWKRARRVPAGAAIFGSLCGVILISLTNVTFETPFIGGPMWLMLAAAAAFLARPPSTPAPQGTIIGWGGLRPDLSGVERVNRGVHAALQSSNADVVWIDPNQKSQTVSRGRLRLGAARANLAAMHSLARTVLRDREVPVVIYLALSQFGWGLIRDYLTLSLVSIVAGSRASFLIHLHGEYRAELQPFPAVSKFLWRRVARLTRVRFVSPVPNQNFEGVSTLYVANSLDPDTAAAVDAAAQALVQREETGRATTFLYLGVLMPSKGVHLVMRAIQSLGRDSSQWHFLFVGPLLKKLDRYGRRFSGQDEWDEFVRWLSDGHENVSWLDAVHGPERFRFFQLSDWLILPSFTEGSPVSILEAVRYGLGIIATARGAIPELASGASASVLMDGTPSADGVAQALRLAATSGKHRAAPLTPVATTGPAVLDQIRRLESVAVAGSRPTWLAEVWPASWLTDA
jgi:glycosyltransferase involved in cell wall biosynthesis